MKWTSFALALCGCFGGGSKPKPTVDGGEPGDGRHEVVSVPITINRNLDLLFVVDDSSDMQGKQVALRQNTPALLNVLQTLPGGFPDVHVGVISSDMGTKPDSSEPAAPGIGVVGSGGCAQSGKAGALQTTGAPVTGNFLRDIKQTDGSRMTNYTGNLADVLGQMLTLGANGCGFEQHLFAMKTALNNNPANTGFLRSDAFLAVLVLADEDDCSARSAQLFQAGNAIGPQDSFRCFRWGVDCDGDETELGEKTNCAPATASPYVDDVASYADFLKSLKQNDPDHEIIFGTIAGAPSPITVEDSMGAASLASSCANATKATPPVRLGALADQLGGTRGDLCNPDLSASLQAFGRRIVKSIGTPCVDGELFDSDPQSAGVQYDCLVYDVQNQGKPNEVRTEIPACGDTPMGLCWRMIQDAQNCPLDDHLSLAVNRDSAPPPETRTIARCR